jgi:hypothetical protein
MSRMRRRQPALTGSRLRQPEVEQLPTPSFVMKMFDGKSRWTTGFDAPSVASYGREQFETLAHAGGEVVVGRLAHRRRTQERYDAAGADAAIQQPEMFDD